MNPVFEIIDIPNLPDITLPEKVDVTDPCYSRDTEYRINDIPVKPGKYHCYAKRSLNDGARLDNDNNIHLDGTYADTRITEITIAHTDIKQEDLKHFEYIGIIEVDAGIAGFFPAPFEVPQDRKSWRAFHDKIRDIDKTRYKRKKNKYESIKDIPIEDNPNDYIYNIKDEIYASEPVENAFFSSSGYGDGTYQLKGIKKDGVYVALRLVFINNDFLFDD